MYSSKLYFGCFDTRITEILDKLWKDIPVFETAVIRCLDSSRDATAITSVLDKAEIPSAISGAGVTLDRSSLELAQKHSGIFCGFDELWFLSRADLQVSIPDRILLTSDGGPITANEARQVGDLMEQNSIPLVLADGCGANCLTFNEVFWNHMADQYVRLE